MFLSEYCSEKKCKVFYNTIKIELNIGRTRQKIKKMKQNPSST